MSASVRVSLILPYTQRPQSFTQFAASFAAVECPQVRLDRAPHVVRRGQRHVSRAHDELVDAVYLVIGNEPLKGPRRIAGPAPAGRLGEAYAVAGAEDLREGHAVAGAEVPRLGELPLGAGEHQLHWEVGVMRERASVLRADVGGFDAVLRRRRPHPARGGFVAVGVARELNVR